MLMVCLVIQLGTSKAPYLGLRSSSVTTGSPLLTGFSASLGAVSIAFLSASVEKSMSSYLIALFPSALPFALARAMMMIRSITITAKTAIMKASGFDSYSDWKNEPMPDNQSVNELKMFNFFFPFAKSSGRIRTHAPTMTIDSKIIHQTYVFCNGGAKKPA